jgi:Protein of unknown function (DUF4058)
MELRPNLKTPPIVHPMLNPFPGMNPYLEHPELWHQVHNRLIVGIADTIADQIAPKYFVSIEHRIYQIIHTIKERYLEVREVATKELITVIEVLSPTNKRSEGRSLYETKRIKILTSLTNLVEIDLLRSGKPMMVQGAPQSQYRVLVSRSSDRPNADLFAFDLQEEIPDFPVPLRGEMPEPIVSLQTILNETYQRGRLDLLIDYTIDPVPGLKAHDRQWMQEILA